MKKCRNFVMIALCLVLLVSLAAPAFAATATAIFVRETVDGYECIGQGNIYDEVNSTTNVTTYVSHGGFLATRADDVLTTINPEMCTSQVTMTVYDAYGFPLNTVTGTAGYLQSAAVYSSSTEIGKSDYYYRFNDTRWGGFTLQANS